MASPPPPPPPPPEEEKEGGSKSRGKICLAVVAVVVVAALTLVILVVTVFRAKRPVTTVDDVALTDLDVALDVARLGVDVNATLDLDLSVKNPNRVGFRYGRTTAYLNYRGGTIGDAPIPAGKISAGETKAVNLTLTVMADRLLSRSQLYTDVLNETLPFNARTKISGKVAVLGLFKLHVTSTVSCGFSVFVGNRSVGDLSCSYDTNI